MDIKLKGTNIDLNDALELLERYSKFLEEEGYMDNDWWSEEPKAIDEFIKTIYK